MFGLDALSLAIACMKGAVLHDPHHAGNHESLEGSRT